jgi:hypothetical protein
MIPIHAILRFLLISELSVNKSVQMALGALNVAGAMEDCGCHATLSRESLAVGGLSKSIMRKLERLNLAGVISGRCMADEGSQRRTSLRGKFPASREFAGNFSEFEPNQAKGVWLMR